jgi:hypothetical protein
MNNFLAWLKAHEPVFCDERIYKSMMGRLLIRHGQEAMGYREVKP